MSMELQIFDEHNKCECGVLARHTHPTCYLKDIHLEPEESKGLTDKKIEELEKRIIALEMRLIYYPAYIYPQQSVYPLYPQTITTNPNVVTS